MRKTVIAVTTALIMVLGATAVYANSPGKGRGELSHVRRATAQYHRVSNAEAAGYEAFLECISSPEGGMGQHYVNFGILDDIVDATEPEAVMYEVGKHGKLHLVGVEYLAPLEIDGVPVPQPELFGQQFHAEEGLGVWALHAWVWRWNPHGTFADFNPRVKACPIH